MHLEEVGHHPLHGRDHRAVDEDVRPLILIVAVVAQAEPFREHEIDLDGREGLFAALGVDDLEIEASDRRTRPRR